MPARIGNIAALSALMACAAVQAADHAYRYLDPDGKPIYSQLPPPAGTPYERVDVSPAGGQGKGKAASGDTRHDNKERAKHSTASEAVPYKDVWRQGERKADQARQGPATVVKPVAAPVTPQCEAGQGVSCKADPSK